MKDQLGNILPQLLQLEEGLQTCGLVALSSIIYIWRSGSRQKSVEKNMADFHS